MKSLIKIQYVDSFAEAENAATAIVGKRLTCLDAKGIKDDVIRMLDL